jgi:hypothetical protein
VGDYFGKVPLGLVKVILRILDLTDLFHVFLVHKSIFEWFLHPSLQCLHNTLGTKNVVKGPNQRLTLVSSRQIGTVLPDQEERVRMRNQKKVKKIKRDVPQDDKIINNRTPNRHIE